MKEATFKSFELRPRDILAGRSKEAYNHEGNQRLRRVIALNLPLYFELATRKGRQVLFASILDGVLRDGARFLERKCNHWVKLTRARAHRKVGHAFRDAALRKSIRTSKHKNTDRSNDTDERLRRKSSQRRQKMEQANDNTSWIDFGVSKHFAPILQLSESSIEPQNPRPSSPDLWKQLESFLSDNTDLCEVEKPDDWNLYDF